MSNPPTTRSALDVPRPRTVPRVQAWAIAARPKSLLVAVGPVLVGTSAASPLFQAVDALTLMAMLLAAVAVQTICNLQNDSGLTVRGGDRCGTRIGLPRATSSGLLSTGQLQFAIVVLIIAAGVPTAALVQIKGWPVVAIGVASLLAALAYMGGPRPIAYTPFGELTVAVFFGLVGVLGSEWVISSQVTLTGTLAAMAVGAMAAAALAVNNHRDQDHDRSIGRRTFAVLYGPKASARLFALLLVAPYALTAALSLQVRSVAPLLPMLTWPMALALLRDFRFRAEGADFNQILYRTFKLGFAFNLLLTAGLGLVNVGA